MAKTIYAQNDEFAASSGSNVDVTGRYSYFDHPPNSTVNLTITSNLGDDQPFRFDLGDTYDLTWTGHGGGIMDDAAIIRSDYVGPGQGAVVFEGLNSITGEPFQMVWTPGFDLEQWYWDNGGGPDRPNAFWTSDQHVNETVQIICYAAGTRIRCAQGDVRVDALRLGDLVETADNGFQRIRFIRKKRQVLQRGGPETKPVLIGAGALGDRFPVQDLIVSQNHRILVGGHQQPVPMVKAEVFVPAKALLCLPRIRRVYGKSEVIWVHFAFDRHEVVFANGCQSESLLPGPVAMRGLSFFDHQTLAELYRLTPENGAAAHLTPARTCLTVGAAQRVIGSPQLQETCRVAREIQKWDASLAATQAIARQGPAARRAGVALAR